MIRKALPLFFVILLFFLPGLNMPTAGLPGAETLLAQETQLSQEQLVSLVAPVALYPDDLLTNVLTAATEPDQVVQALQYVQRLGGKVTSMQQYNPDRTWTMVKDRGSLASE